MMGASKRNVKPEWVYPDQKVADMIYAFGKYGLIKVQSLFATSPEQEQKCQDIFNAVMSGLEFSPRGQISTLLEDMPEYFSEFGVTSPYLPGKRPYVFRDEENKPTNAFKQLEKAIAKGVTIKGKQIKLSEFDYEKAEMLVREIEQSVLQAHASAIDINSSGILPTTKKAITDKQKKGYDACDGWFMNQFPSFSMDSELEKSQKQLMRVLDGEVGSQPVYAEPMIPLSEYTKLAERIAVLEKNLEVGAGGSISSVGEAAPQPKKSKNEQKSGQNAAPAATEAAAQ